MSINLHEAQQIRGLRRVRGRRRRLAERGCKYGSLPKGAMLNSRRVEGRRRNFFPEIEPVGYVNASLK